jgi:hypothetical protein
MIDSGRKRKTGLAPLIFIKKIYISSIWYSGTDEMNYDETSCKIWRQCHSNGTLGSLDKNDID